MEKSLAQRVQRLEDIESIRKLKHEYCYACDDGYNPERLKALFSPKAVWEAEGFGKYVGPEAIGNFFSEVSGKIVAAAHLVLNDLIEIEKSGDKAVGKWRNIQPVTVKKDTGALEAMWMLAKYDEKYIKIEGRWLFLHLNADIQFSSPYEQGWADLWPKGS